MDGPRDADVGVLLAKEIVLRATDDEGDVVGEVETEAGDEEEGEDVREDD